MLHESATQIVGYILDLLNKPNALRIKIVMLSNALCTNIGLPIGSKGLANNTSWFLFKLSGWLGLVRCWWKYLSAANGLNIRPMKCFRHPFVHVCKITKWTAWDRNRPGLRPPFQTRRRNSKAWLLLLLLWLHSYKWWKIIAYLWLGEIKAVWKGMDG